ncbi:dTDP-glucose 4,6-dehydratase [Thermoplasmatales archaeon ex4484_30]|nr:MAG: dTDP-glucose 4,6-dehydratase [Thermoplasmatales archaeon ex4484_30]
MRIMVTGGAGFIGSNFIHYLLNKYEDVEIVNYDKLTYAGNLDNLKDIEDDPRYHFIKGDICDKELVEKVIKEHEIEQIVNFAAESHVDRSITGPEPFIKTDIFGTFTLLEASRKSDLEKYIQISTDEVYGSINEGSFEENDPLNPSSPYSASKAGADMLVIAYYKTYGLSTVITRSSNNYGPYQYPEKLIPVLIIRALRNKPLPIYGNGMNVRDWLYAEDNCEAIDLVRIKGEKGEIYNIAANEEWRNIDVAKLVLKYLNKSESLITFVGDRPGHDFRYSLKVDKIKKLGWKPKIRFPEGLKRTVEWYISNEWWWRKLI